MTRVVFERDTNSIRNNMGELDDSGSDLAIIISYLDVIISVMDDIIMTRFS